MTGVQGRRAHKAGRREPLDHCHVSLCARSHCAPQVYPPCRWAADSASVSSKTKGLGQKGLLPPVVLPFPFLHYSNYICFWTWPVQSPQGMSKTIRKRHMTLKLVGPQIRCVIWCLLRGPQKSSRSFVLETGRFECRFPCDSYGRGTAPFCPFLGEGFWGNIRRPLVPPAPLVYC